MEFEAVIGLEIHVQLNTKTKLFCSCPNKFGAEPNTLVCPVCLGLPGALPVLNEEAVRFALRVAKALNATIHRDSAFYRKNYFYPDLPKGYQITQYTTSIATDGEIVFKREDGSYGRVRIERMNLEEEAAKSIHTEEGDVLLDFNRSGIPLLEIVTRPDIRSPHDARLFLVYLKRTLRYLGISNCDMEKGELRVDSNISVRLRGEEKLGTKVELKNLNSFKAVEDALSYEYKRQVEALKEGERIVQETRHWDENERVTRPMRTKEEAHDYRYFPEPDLLPLHIEDKFIEESVQIPELPLERLERFIKEYALPYRIADVLTDEEDIADYFEAVNKSVGEPKLTSNFIVTEVLRDLKEENISIKNFVIEPDRLAELLNLVKNGKITHTIAKDIYAKMKKSKKSASSIMEEEGIKVIGEEDVLVKMVDEVMENHPDIVEKYKKGKVGVIGVLIGEIMKKTKGQADARKVRELLEKKLSED